jgi:hypothetical protein
MVFGAKILFLFDIYLEYLRLKNSLNKLENYFEYQNIFYTFVP